jgi:hypothetical protein
MDYVSSIVDYLKYIFTHYVYNINQYSSDRSEIETSITVIQNVKIIDEKIGNVKEIIHLLNELSPKFLNNLKKNHKFTEKLLWNKVEIHYIIKWIEIWRSENPTSCHNYTVDDVIINTNMIFLYNKMLLIKERNEIVTEYSEKNKH